MMDPTIDPQAVSDGAPDTGDSSAPVAEASAAPAPAESPAPDATIGMSIPSDSAATAVVTAAADQPQPDPDADPDAWTTLYDATGAEIQVKNRDVVTFLRRGFERVPLDPHALAQEIPLYAQSLGQAVQALEQETAESGAIDALENGAHHVMEMAYASFEDAYQRFRRGLWARYKAAQPTEDTAPGPEPESQPAPDGSPT